MANFTETTMTTGLRYEILIDHRENKSQCTIYPLRERTDFQISYYGGGLRPILAFTSDILLHVNGIPLDEFAPTHPQPRSIATIDCTWKRIPTTLRRIRRPLPRLVKIPTDFLTAYPRRSKIEGMDPDGGLATIEALFIAAAFFGKWDESLLEKYHFKKEFLQVNSQNWKKYALGPAGNSVAS